MAEPDLAIPVILTQSASGRDSDHSSGPTCLTTPMGSAAIHVQNEQTFKALFHRFSTIIINSNYLELKHFTFLVSFVLLVIATDIFPNFIFVY